MAESLRGTIDSIIFHNPENGFSVLRVRAESRRDPAVVVGHLAGAAAGEFVTATGSWVNDRDRGLQFKAEALRTTPPDTAEGIERFLASGLIKGIGPHYAARIVETFGTRTLHVIDESPAFLQEVKGIGPRRLERIRDSWQQQKAVRAIVMFLQAHGIGTARAVRIYKTYGASAIDVIQQNPYRLATDIWGIGFQTADELARKLGLDPNSPQRALAALRYVLKELSGEGHVGFPETGVIEETAKLTGIDQAIIRAVIETGRKEGELVREPFAAGAAEHGDEPWLYLKPLFLAEEGVARGLRQLRGGPHPLPQFDADRALAWVEARMGIALAPTQRDAIRQAATRKVLVVTGGPGVGKTTIVRGILEIFRAKGLVCALCAPTGRAAKRLTETTGQEARTIHRLLEFDPLDGGFKRQADDPLEADLIVVDEASMVDVVLMNQLLRAVPPTACLVLVGDVDQLPSVGPGTVLADIIRSAAVPVARLTEIFRQAGQSWIVRAAHQVNRGELPESAPAGQGDFFFVEAPTPEAILDKLITMVRDRIPARFGLDPLRDVQVLTPMNRLDLGVRTLNERLQAVFNPASAGPSVERNGWTFRVGDKVLQTVNDYKKEAFNGDVGKVSAIDVQEQELTVRFDSREVVYDFGELDELALAYALTIHKSQGSEYPAVVIPLHTQHYMLLQRNLLYTGITRGKKLVVVVGSKKALATAVQRQDTAQRCTALTWRLRREEHPGPGATLA